MAAISPRVGEYLVKATRSKDVDEALGKVLGDYLTLKVRDLEGTIDRLEEKWGMDFETFKRQLQQEALPNDGYDFETEQDFWRWEEAETLKAHYERLRAEWT